MKIILLFTFAIQIVLSLNCCEQLYLSAKGILADNYAPLLGIYSYMGPWDNETPVYSKTIEIWTDSGLDEKRYYLVHETNGKSKPFMVVL